MSRNLKALGLALVAVFAMSAMAATAAYAEDEGRVVLDENTEGHLGENDKATIQATDVGEENDLEFTAFEKEGKKGEVTCDQNDFHGEVKGGTHTSIAVETTFGGPPATQNCEAETLPATVHNNGCELRFDTFQTTEDETWEATTDLICPEGEPGLQVTVFAGGAHGFRVCTITVPPQNGIEKVVAHNNINTNEENSGAHDLTLTAEATNITATRTGLCGHKHTKEATMHGEVTVAAENADKEPIDIYVEHHTE